jgi:hypothetical protein
LNEQNGRLGVGQKEYLIIKRFLIRLLISKKIFSKKLKYGLKKSRGFLKVQNSPAFNN